MKKVLHFLVDHWYIPLMVLAAIVLALLSGVGRRGFDPSAWVSKELDAIRAGSEARDQAARDGAEAALAKVREDKADALASLDKAQAEKAERLKDDPVALSRFLVRVGRDQGNL